MRLTQADMEPELDVFWHPPFGGEEQAGTIEKELADGQWKFVPDTLPPQWFGVLPEECSRRDSSW